jgi:hypothetical protein
MSASDDDDDDRPAPPAKKPARPPEGAVKKGVPPKGPPATKKPAPKPVDAEDEDEDEEEEVRRPVKKKPARRDDDDEDDDEPREKVSVRESTALNVLAPVGGSFWGLGSLVFGVLASVSPVFLAILYFLWNAHNWLGKAGYAVVGLAAFVGLLAIPLGVMSFIFRPKRASYGGVTSYMRAIIGIALGVIGIIICGVVGWYISTVVR